MYFLVINPGSTSTKVAVYNEKYCFFSHTENHIKQELEAFRNIKEQKLFRKHVVLSTLEIYGFRLQDIDVFVGRGGLVRHLPSGVYLINEKYIHDAVNGLNGQHASNLGGILAYELAKEAGTDKKAYTVDPVVVDEYDDIARISGMPDVSRVRAFHALNHKAVARRYAKERFKDYEKLNLIVAHLGGGISVGAHRQGRIVDVNSALGGDGPFSPERTGRVPCLSLMEMCYSGKFSQQEMYNKLVGGGGLYSWFDTTDVREIEALSRNGKQQAKTVLDAMSYQIAKEIAACAAVLKGAVDAIIITGGIAFSNMVTGFIIEHISFITSEIVIYPGEDEMFALANGVIDGLSGKREIFNY